jgi:DNA-binding NarL/FixJ family response regulator
LFDAISRTKVRCGEVYVVSLRVLITDDQPLARTGLRTILDLEPGVDVAGEAANGREAVALAEELKPDLVIMDLRMPGGDGISAIRKICARAGEGPPRVLVLTTFSDDESVFAALQAGASGFLLKDTSPARLLEAIRVVSSGEGLLDPAVTRRVIAAGAGRPGEAHEPPGFEDLTPREREIFYLVAAGHSNGAMAEQLQLGLETVRTHVKHALFKLALRDRVQLVVMAYETGLVRPGPNPAGR